MYYRSQIAVLMRMAAGVILAALAVASSHHNLDGTWVLVPTQSDFGGHQAIQTGNLTISERQHHIYVSRTFNFSGDFGTASYTFSDDGSENSTIHEGKTIKSKAKWQGDVLQVTTTQDGATTVERYTLQPDGTLRLTVERPDHGVLMLAFQRQ